MQLFYKIEQIYIGIR